MKKRNFLAVLASCAVVAGMFPMTVSAANYSADIDGEKNVRFEKYLVMKKDANVPKADFEFTITPGSAIATADGKMEVLAGIGEPKFFVGGENKSKVEFTSADTTKDESAAGDKTVKFVTKEDKTDEKFATKTIDIDFTDIKFPEPGVYRYIITEKDSTVAGIANDSEKDRTLDVYVVDNSTATERKLKVNSYVIHTGTEAPARNIFENGEYKVTDSKLEKKSTGFTNTYSTQNLEFGKKVTGNQGSKDKYFKFTLKVDNAAGATLTVIPDGMESEPKTNAATKSEYTEQIMKDANSVDNNDTADGQQIVVDDTGTVTKDFYLNDGQYVKILGLPKGATYTVTEDNEDYNQTDGTDKVWKAAVGNEGDNDYQAAKTYSDSTNGTIATADIHTGYTNNRSGAIPTGVILSVAAPVVIGLAVLGGIVFLVIKNKKRDDEEEE